MLCHIGEIEDPGSRGFTVGIHGRSVDILVVRKGDDVYAFLNRCPHTGSPLDWMPDQFLSIDRNHIQCATHAALFQIDNGYCVSGPCSGESLQAVPLEVRSGQIYLADADGTL